MKCCSDWRGVLRRLDPKAFFKDRLEELNLVIRKPAFWATGSVISRLFGHLGIWLPVLFIHWAIVWWYFVDRFGIPLLFWSDNNWHAFLAGFSSSLLLGFATVAFVVVDYSLWIYQRIELADRLSTGTQDVSEGYPHWSNSLYNDFHSSKRHPNQSFLDMLEFQAYLVRRLFFAALTIGFISFALSFALGLPFGDQETDKSNVFHPVQDGWKGVPLFGGIVLGCVVIVGISRFQIALLRQREKLLGWVFSNTESVYERGLRVFRWIDRKFDLATRFLLRLEPSKEDEEANSEEKTDQNENDLPNLALLFHSLWALLWFFSFYLCFAAAPLLPWTSEVAAVPAICAFFGGVVALYVIAIFLLRRFRLFGGALILFSFGIGVIFSPNVRYPVEGFHVRETVGDRANSEVRVQEFHRLESPTFDHRPDFSPDAERLGDSLASDISPTLYRNHRGLGEDAQWWQPDKPMVIVCVSGGGITAELWATRMLTKINSKLTVLNHYQEPFSDHVRLITGASGGMVGASAWVGLLASISDYYVPVHPYISRSREGDSKLDVKGVKELLSNRKKPVVFGHCTRRHQEVLSELAREAKQSGNAEFDFWFLAELEQRLCSKSSDDQLSEVVHSMMFRDWGPLGLLVHFGNWKDRGLILEEQWKRLYQPPRVVYRSVTEDMRTEIEFRDKLPTGGLTSYVDFSFKDLLPLEAGGKIPSLIVSPALSDDGRRVLFSNLEISRLCQAVRGIDNGSWAPATHPSLDGRQLLSDQCYEEIPLRRFLRLNATFPLISPPASFNVAPKPIHFVDAGYYDVHGASVALEWLREYWLPAIRENNPNAPRHVIVIELDAYPRFGPRGEKEREPTFVGEALDHLLHEIKYPLNGLMKRSRANGFRNDEALEGFLEVYGEPEDGRRTVIQCFRFTNIERASLSWKLSEAEKKRIYDWSDAITGAGRSQQQRSRMGIQGRDDGIETESTEDTLGHPGDIKDDQQRQEIYEKLGALEIDQFEKLKAIWANAAWRKDTSENTK